MSAGPTRAWLGVDGGSSSARLCLVDADGHVLGRSTSAAGTNLHVSGEAAVARLGDAVAALLAAHPARVVGFVLGTAGIDVMGDADRFAAAYAALASDSRLAGDPHAGGFPAPRIVSDVDVIGAVGVGAVRVAVIAGTGSNVVAGRYAPGAPLPHRRAYVGGLDLPLTDWGSAARIGEGALVACVRAATGLDARGPLTDALHARFGIACPDGWRAWKDVRAGLDKAGLAALAREVAVAAEAGDAVAAALLDAAGDQLAEGILAALRTLPAAGDEPVEVLCVGGVLTGNARVRTRVERLVHAAWPAARFADADAALGAARLALAG